MAELVAVGPEPAQHWRKEVVDGQVTRIGRAPRNGWAVPWDLLISREHADLIWQNGSLRVSMLQTARNPILFQGEETPEFNIGAGEQFQIGNTLFRLEQLVGDEILEEYTFKADQIKGFGFRNADQRLELLSHMPQLITQSRTDEELAGRLVKLLLEANTHADSIAMVESVLTIGNPEAKIISWDTRLTGNQTVSGPVEAGRFRPSQRLIQAAIERNDTVLHVSTDTPDRELRITVNSGVDWAFCTPIKAEACQGWCLYACGRFGMRASGIHKAEDLTGDIRFTELVAQFIAAVRQVRRLEHQQAGMSHFFAPMVLEMIRKGGADSVLAPRESDITVIFCDVRGFSRKAERAQHDLHELLRRVSEALGMMTRGILRHEGVIADFQGDAALAFWGWPYPLPDGPLSACRAALDISLAFTESMRNATSALADFRVGIGIAHGRAIAGRIGTQEQSKVGVFGSVVNLGSRLESMTKELRASILLDEQTANFAREHLPRTEGRCRRLGRIRPYGMDAPVVVSELLPPAAASLIGDQNIADFEGAVDALTAGDWQRALEVLDGLPVHDRAKDFLMTFIALNDYDPPANWDGVITMSNK